MIGDSPRLRLRIVGILAASLFATLLLRLWFLQVVESPEFVLAADAQQTREVAIEAPRGRMLDAQGRVLVDNQITIVVTADPLAMEAAGIDIDAMLYGLSEELSRRGQPSKLADLRDRLDDPQYGPLEPRPLIRGIDEEFEVFLLERSEEFPGLTVVREAERVYPYGTLAAHLVGYVGRITEEEYVAKMGTADAPLANPKAYELNDYIGKAGLERTFEDDLRGIPGVRTFEVDPSGRPVQQVSYVPPQPGHDIQLTIDLEVQHLAELALERGLLEARGSPSREAGIAITAPAGAVAMLDPDTGAVQALASFPTYNPSEFVGGISTARYQELLGSETTDDPFTNRAIAGQYPPASTFKLVTAYAGLLNGLIAPGEWYPDPGVYYAQGCQVDKEGCAYRDSNDSALGSVNLERSLTLSSDVYYYRLGDRFWVEDGRNRNGIQDAAELFGFHHPTGIDLPFEQAGHIPTPERRQERHESNPEAFPFPEWYSGDNIISAIGQGEVLATPLQMANAYASFANGGTVHTPEIVTRVLVSGGQPGDPEDVVRVVEPTVVRTLPFTEPNWQAMHNGFVGVTQRGTARPAFVGWDHYGWPVAGKTGTAEVGTSGDGRADNSVFAAYAPAGDPQYAVVVILEEAGFGGDAAAPVARWILEPLSGALPMPPLRTVFEQVEVAVEEDCVALDGEGLRPTTTTTTIPIATSTTTTILVDPFSAEECL